MLENEAWARAGQLGRRERPPPWAGAREEGSRSQGPALRTCGTEWDPELGNRKPPTPPSLSARFRASTTPAPIVRTGRGRKIQPHPCKQLILQELGPFARHQGPGTYDLIESWHSQPHSIDKGPGMQRNRHQGPPQLLGSTPLCHAP